MRHQIFGTASGLAIASLLFCATASAQDDRGGSYFQERMAAPSNALELDVGAGYSQGLGMVAPGRSMPHVGGAGAGLVADVGYRISRNWGVSVEGQYSELSSTDSNTAARGLAGNLGATYHFTPVLRGDPWVRLGTGYRMQWESNPTGAVGTTPLRHGFELVAAKIGYDVRVSEDVAIAPVIGADLTTFLWQDQSGGNNATFARPQVATFLFGGLQGRFDIGGTRTGRSDAAARTTPPVFNTSAPVGAAPANAGRPNMTSVTPAISIADDVLKACALDLGAIDRAPKFDFDDSDLHNGDLYVLQQVARCFTTGPMKSYNMQLIGRADPRGSEEYNEVLGMKRATSVQAFLTSQGVSQERINARSRGKLDATGHDETTYSADRRVDIFLKP